MSLPDRVDAIHAGVLELGRALAGNRAARSAPRDRVFFPRIPGGVRPAADQIVDAGDALTATLGAVSLASGRLAGQGVSLALGSRPLSMQLAGELVGYTPEDGRISISVTPRGKEKADGQR